MFGDCAEWIWNNFDNTFIQALFEEKNNINDYLEDIEKRKKSIQEHGHDIYELGEKQRGDEMVQNARLQHLVSKEAWILIEKEYGMSEKEAKEKYNKLMKEEENG